MIYHVTWLTPKGGEERQIAVEAHGYGRLGNVTFFYNKHGVVLREIRNVLKVVEGEQH